MKLKEIDENIKARNFGDETRVYLKIFEKSSLKSKNP